MREFFEDSLTQSKDVLEGQLALAASQMKRVQKVILTGGFGQSPSLQSYLKTYLDQARNIDGREIEFIVPDNP
jgi:actin-related protein